MSSVRLVDDGSNEMLINSMDVLALSGRYLKVRFSDFDGHHERRCLGEER